MEPSALWDSMTALRANTLTAQRMAASASATVSS